MRLDEPKARLRLLEDGTLDWLRGSQVDIPARSVVLENITVTGGEIQFVDEQSSRTWLLTGLNADISADTLAGPWSVDGHVLLEGEAAAFNLSTNLPGPTGLPLRLRLRPEERPVSLFLDGLLELVDGKPVYGGAFVANLMPRGEDGVGEDDDTPAPRLRGDFTLTNERIDVPAYRLEVGGLDDPYVVTGQAKLDAGLIPEFLLTADGQQMDVNRLSGQGAQAKTARYPAASLQQRLERVIEMASTIPVPTVPGKASLKLPAIVAGDTVIRDVALEVAPAGQGWQVEKATAIFPGRTQLEASGRLDLRNQPSFVGDLLIASTQPSGLASWIAGSVDPALRRLQSFGFAASVNLSAGLQRFENLELSIGPAILNGRIERENPEGVPSSLSVDLSGPALDLDAARAIAGLMVGEGAERQILADRIAARLKIDTVRAFEVDSRDLDTVFTLDHQSVAVERLNIGEIAGASLRLTGRAEGTILEHDGQARVFLTAADPADFLQFLLERLGDAPWLHHLRNHASWYADTSLSADVAFGAAQGGGLAASITGTSNGSRVTASYQNNDLFDLVGRAETRTSVTLSNQESQILLGQAGLSPLPFDTGLGGELQLTVDQQAGQAKTTVVFADGDGTRLNAQSTQLPERSSILAGDWSVRLQSPDLSSHLLAVGAGIPQIASGVAVDLESAFTHTDEVTRIGELKGRVNSGDVAIKGELAWLPVAPKFTGEISLGSLDLSWLVESVTGPVADAASGAFVAEPFAARGAVLDVDADLKVASFDPGYAGTISDFTAKLRRTSQEVALEGASGQWLGGALAGRLTLANAEGSGLLQARLDLKNADLASSLSTLAAERGLDVAGMEGRYDLTLVAESTGTSIAALMSGVSGSGELRARDVLVPTMRLDILAPLLAEADTLGTEVAEPAVTAIADRLVRSGSTTVEEVFLPFSLVDGTVRVQNARLETDPAIVTGNLRLDLPTQTLNADMRVALAAGEAALTGADPEFQMSFAGGALAPKRSLSATDLSNFVALRAFERERRRVEALQANVLEKQRLRREAALARFNADERAKAEAEAAAAAAAAAEAEAERIRLEEEARLRDAANATSGTGVANGTDAENAVTPNQFAPQGGTTNSTPPVQTPPVSTGTRTLPVPQQERVIRQPLPPVLNGFEDIPGVN